MAEVYLMHDSWDLNYRSPFGASKSGSTVTLSIEVYGFIRGELELIYFDGRRETIEMNKKERDNRCYFEANINIDGDYSGIINYYFSLYREGEKIYYGNNEDLLGGEGKIYGENPKYFQITVYKDFKVPAWYKEGIVYQIFVDRFFNGNKDGKILNPKKNSFIYGNWHDDPMYVRDNKGAVKRWDFYGGNLQGIIEKLDYIKSLNVTAIYLNPIFEAVSNHKYDTGDYKNIDPMFGDEKKFKELCEKAHKRGIQIILDGVFSHTGSDSVYFNKEGNYESLGAYQSKDSPYYSWYRFYEYPDKYECWWGIDNHPNVEELEESYKEYIITAKDSVINKWMNLGADGWRLDVADELPDEFIEEIKKRMKKLNKDSLLLGEVWEDASNKISYSKRRKYFFGEELDSVTNYPFRDSLIAFLKGEISSFHFMRRMMSLYENYPKEAFYANLNILGTHDTERILTILNEKGENTIDYLKLAVAIQMTMPGVPLIYYGDEAGLKGGKDPDNRKTYPWGREDKDVFEIYKLFTSIRDKYDLFKKGEFKFYNLNEDILCYERYLGDERAFIIINRNSKATICLSDDAIDKEGIYLDLLKDVRCNRLNIEVAPLEVKILIKHKSK